jgi:heme exporter protein D
MSTVSEFLRMGGYASFVWPAYGVTLAVMLGLLLQSLGSYRAQKRELDRLQGGRLKGGRRKDRQ